MRWIILTKDSRLRHNTLELIALMKSGTHSFILTSGEQTGPDMAKAYAAALPAMIAMIEKFQAPFVGTVSLAGNVSVYLTHDQLIKQIASDQTNEENRNALQLPKRNPS